MKMPNRPVHSVIQGQTLVTVSPDATVTDAARVMTGNRCGAVPVMVGTALVGIFTERDVMSRVVAAGRDPLTTLVAAVMTRDPATISPDRPVIHALHIMDEGGFRHLPVLDRNRLVGMMSIRDAIGREIEIFEQDCQEKEAIAEILA
jgi:CBS domain-containing protein